MSLGTDTLDRALLEQVQADFPLAARPFAALGEALGIDEATALARVRDLEQAGFIRHIGAIFDTRRLGYQSTLVAFHLPPARLKAVAAEVSAHPGVSHNYARPHHYNLWFTLAVPPDGDLRDEILCLAGRTGVEDWLDLPALRVFKIRTHFRLAGGTDVRTEPAGGPPPSPRPFVQADIPYVRALQQDLPLVPRPFALAAGQLAIGEEALLDRARALLAAGIMRRFSAVLRHRQVGYAANGMACWAVPEAQIEEAGQRAAGFAQVSHCYQRPAHPPHWPYNLFTMIHGRAREDVETTVIEIAHGTGIRDYEVLYSTHEFKKERIRYFES